MSIWWSDPQHFLKSQGKFFFLSFLCTLFYIFLTPKSSIEWSDLIQANGSHLACSFLKHKKQPIFMIFYDFYPFLSKRTPSKFKIISYLFKTNTIYFYGFLPIFMKKSICQDLTLPNTISYTF